MAIDEACSSKIRSQEPLTNLPDGRIFHSGFFVGIDRRTGQYILFGDHGIKLARTVLRLPNAQK